MLKGTKDKKDVFGAADFNSVRFCNLTDTVDVGFSYKSPIWYETWHWNSSGEIGRNQLLELDADLPMIFSLGFAYKGIDRVILAADFRYFLYSETDLFGETPPPAGTGLGWQDVFAAALGGQFQATEKLALRLGYLYNENPISSVNTLFNTQLPAIYEHAISVGTTYKMTDYLSMSLAYVHAFENEIQGPIAELAGANVAISSEANSVVFGMTIRFGPNTERDRS